MNPIAMTQKVGAKAPESSEGLPPGLALCLYSLCGKQDVNLYKYIYRNILNIGSHVMTISESRHLASLPMQPIYHLLEVEGTGGQSVPRISVLLFSETQQITVSPYLQVVSLVKYLLLCVMPFGSTWPTPTNSKVKNLCARNGKRRIADKMISIPEVFAVDELSFGHTTSVKHHIRLHDQTACKRSRPIQGRL